MSKRTLIFTLPYIIFGLFATKLAEGWRYTIGNNMGERILRLGEGLNMAFATLLPSFYPNDLLYGILCGAGLALVVCYKRKNAKKYRHGLEHGSARWGTPKDIAP